MRHLSTSVSPTVNNPNGSDFSCIAAAWQADHTELSGYLTHRLLDAATADDVLHDAFVKAMRHGQGLCVLEQPRAWLFQVARKPWRPSMNWRAA